MSKRDYEAIATSVRRVRDRTSVPQCKAVADAIAYDLSWELTETNPRFDRKRFLIACGTEEES